MCHGHPARSINYPRTLTNLKKNSLLPLKYIVQDMLNLLTPPPLSLASLLKRHALIITSGNHTNPFIASKLVSIFSSFSRPDISSHIFFTSIPALSHDTFLWNSLIKSYFQNSNFHHSLSLFSQMHASGFRPDHFTVPMVASACAETAYIVLGKSVHANCVKDGISVEVSSSFVYMYFKCGGFEDAIKLFDEMSKRDLVAWTTVVTGCVTNGESELGLIYYTEMIRVGGISPGYRILETAIQACVNLDFVREGMCLHGVTVKFGFDSYSSVKSLILSLYSKCDQPDDAYMVFRELRERDIVSWTLLVGVYSRNGLIKECFQLFREMIEFEIEPDGVFLSSLLVGFDNANDVYGAMAFHGILLRINLDGHKLVSSSLLSMYCKFGTLDNARKLLYEKNYKDAESWSLMASEYVKRGLYGECLYLFKEMTTYDSNMLISAVLSCSYLGALPLGQSIHCRIIKNKVDVDLSVSNSLISMYGKCERLDLARRIFDQLCRDIVTWNCMISAYTHAGHSYNALALFDQMLLENMTPNTSTLLCVISACSHMAALHKGMWIHKYIKELGLEFNVSLYTALVDMYAKCGKLETARELFHLMQDKDVVTYNVMISGYGIHGNAKDALEIFKEMETSDVKPNGVTFLALLSTCSHAGLVKEGKSIFRKMMCYSIKPTLKHYACMVDLLGRSGSIYEAEALINSMPMKPDGCIWGALLGACRMHNDVEMGAKVANQAFEMEPDNDGYYVLMSNMYGCHGKWKELESLREMMKSRGVKKRAGWSSIEINETVHVFAVGERINMKFEDIILVLGTLSKLMEE